MKKQVFIVLTLIGLVVILVAPAAASTNNDHGTVSFSVVATQSITAESLNLGNLASGTHTSTQNPVTVSSNIGWTVNAQADGDFSDGGNPAVILPIGNLAMKGNTMSSTIPIVIAEGVAGSNVKPDVNTSITVPYDGNLVGKTLNATITYTVLPQ